MSQPPHVPSDDGHAGHTSHADNDGYDGGRPVLRVHRRDATNSPDRSWVLVPPVSAGDGDPLEAVRRDCRALASISTPAQALLRAIAATPDDDGPVTSSDGAPTFESLSVRVLDAVHAAAGNPAPDVAVTGLDRWLRSRLRRRPRPDHVVAGILAAAEAAHSQAAGRPDVVTALLCVTVPVEVFAPDDDPFPWDRCGPELVATARRIAPRCAPVVADVVTAHRRRDAAVRCLDAAAPRRAAAHAAAARTAFRRIGCTVDAAGCDVLEGLGLLGTVESSRTDVTPYDRAVVRSAAVARMERARSLFEEFAFDGHAAHCALVLGAVALDEGRAADAVDLGRAAYRGSVRCDAPPRQCALAAELVADAYASRGDWADAEAWYRRSASLLHGACADDR